MAKAMKVPETVEGLPATCMACGGPAGAGKGKLSFKSFLMTALEGYQANDRSTLKGLKGARRLNKIADEIEEADGTIELEDADFELVKNAVEEYNWNLAIQRRLVSYFEAVDSAEPVKKEDSGKDKDKGKEKE